MSSNKNKSAPGDNEFNMKLCWLPCREKVATPLFLNIKFLTIFFVYILKKYPGAVLNFWSEGCKKFCHLLAGGCQPLISKHINLGLTYDLLIVIYHSRDISLHFYQNIAHIYLILFKRALSKQIISKLSLVWPYLYLSSLIWWKYYLSDSK